MFLDVEHIQYTVMIHHVTKYIILGFVWWCDVCVFVFLVADSSNMPDFNL